MVKEVTKKRNGTDPIITQSRKTNHKASEQVLNPVQEALNGSYDMAGKSRPSAYFLVYEKVQNKVGKGRKIQILSLNKQQIYFSTTHHRGGKTGE